MTNSPQPAALLEGIRKEVEATCMRPVSESESLISSGLLDSVSIVDLAVALERRFKVKIPNEALTEVRFDSVRQIGDVIAGLM